MWKIIYKQNTQSRYTSTPNLMSSRILNKTSQKNLTKVVPLSKQSRKTIGSLMMLEKKNGDRDNDPGFPIIRQNSSFRITWDVIQVIILSYVTFYTPYVISFFSFKEYENHWSWNADRIIEIFYICDIALNFRTTIMSKKDGKEITDGKKIAWKYFKGWFFFDLFVTIPWDLILVSAFGYFIAARVPRLLRVLRLSRIARVARLLKIRQIMEFCEDHLYISRNYIAVIQLLMTTAVVAHFTACGFYFVSTLNTSYATKSWVARYKMIENEPHELYVASLYWAFTTMVTVGYGDIIPDTHIERVYCIVAMIVSAGTYAFIIASMTSIVAQMNVTRSKYSERMNELNAYMESRQFPRDLKLRSRKYYRYFLQKKTVYDETTILNDLPTNLAQEISEHYVNSTIKNIQLFQDIDKGFTSMIAINLKPTFCGSDNLIIKQGEVAKEMFIVTRGILQVFHRNEETKTDHIITYLYDGDHFGEMALLLEEQDGKRNSSIKSKSEFCELYTLEYNVLQLGLSRYSDALSKIMEIAVSRKELLRNLQKMKLVNLVSNFQNKTIEKRFRKMANASRFASLGKSFKFPKVIDKCQIHQDDCNL